MSEESVEKKAPSPDAAVLRIIDANINRASEGLRVVEDFARFALRDQLVTEICKRIRHHLTSIMSPLISSGSQCRDTRDDVGTEIRTDTEYIRDSAQAVALANIKRVEQALRSLEEYGKTISSTIAIDCEALRYQAYELEIVIRSLVEGQRRLSNAVLYVLIDTAELAERTDSQLIEILTAGVDVLQFREKKMDDRELVDRARRLRDITRQTGTLFVLNDRPDIARLVGADAIHLGQDDFSVREARSIIGEESLIGVSTHTIEQARQAVLDGANYIGVGPTFPSKTKSFTGFPGLELLRESSRTLSIPAFAIGGIDESNLDQVVSHGGQRVAVCGAVWRSTDPVQAVTILRERLAGPHSEVTTDGGLQNAN